MVDLEFVDAVASALNRAVVSVQGRDSPAMGDLQRICRSAARELLFELDGKSLLDLAMAKLAAERDLAPKSVSGKLMQDCVVFAS